jgi:hypothetical protein
MAPPRCRMGAITPQERAAVMAKSPIGGKYDTRVNRESAYEMLNQRAAAAPAPGQAPPARGGRTVGEAPGQPQSQPQSQMSEILWGTNRRQGMVETMAKQAARSVGSTLGRQILRGVLGGILGGASRR